MTPAEDARLLLKPVLVLIQDLEARGETIPLVPELLALDALHQELRRRVG